MRSIVLAAFLACSNVAFHAVIAVASERFTERIAPVLEESCLDCHQGEGAEGQLDLGRLKWKPNDRANRDRWVLIHDRVSRGQMPPEDAAPLPLGQRAEFVKVVATELHDADRADVIAHGRGPVRRLTRDEYEQNLRDLLQLPHLDIRDRLPADREKDRCNKVAEVLDISRIQMEAYLDAADAALRAAVAPDVKPRLAEHHSLPATRMFLRATVHAGRESVMYAKDSQMVPLSNKALEQLREEDSHDPEMELAIFRSASWPYHGYPDTFLAEQAGAYRIRFSARAVRQVRDFRLRPAWQSVPMTFRARKRSAADVSGDVRATGGIIDVQPQVAEYETMIRLKENETFEYSLLGLPVPRPLNDDGPLYYDFPPMPEGGHRGIAFQWLEITGPIDSASWPSLSHQVLFDDLPIRPRDPSDQRASNLGIEIVSDQPEQDAVGLLRRFIRRAERHPTSEETRSIYERLVLAELQRGQPLAEALLTGYSAFLCSGEFLFLQEPIHSDERQRDVHHAIASRLSHFLTNTRPDPALMALAEDQKLTDAEVLAAETDRLVDSDRFDQFIKNFSDHWLSLKDIRRDQPDIRLYPEYRFDDYLIDSLRRETRTFLRALVRENLPITALVNTDFVFANDRLSRHYDLPRLAGSPMRKTSISSSSPYGGLLTQGAIMKVSANGTATSPVLRGAWIMERIVGDTPPPPPAPVPAIEPDLRGATTIRQQLSQHTQDASCANCHAKFDPVGFALENFDVMGGWRDRYRSLEKGDAITGIDRAGHRFQYFVADTIDASGRLPGGGEFHSIQELKAILKSQPRRLAQNWLERLTLYATGTPVRFSDRKVIESILDECSQDGYRTADLLRCLVQSKIFMGAG